MRRIFALPIALLATMPETAPAGEALDCREPLTQMDMNECAGLAYYEADAALNATWRDIITRMQEERPDVAGVLRDAQRLWISFRDATCEAEAMLFVGGSIRSSIHANCLRQLTEQREKDLRLAFDTP